MKNASVWVMPIAATVLLATQGLHAAPIRTDIKNTVGFVFVEQGGDKIPYGTGFFVAVRHAQKEDYAAGYFVTAKHVVRTADQKDWLSEFFLRLNRRDGKSEYLTVPVVPKGDKKNIYTHWDPNVDLAVVPLLIDHKVFDVKYLADDKLTTKEDYQTLKIREGSDVFFTGLFTPYVGHERNYPIVRFGRVALVTDEKIEWKKGHKSNLYLIESASFGGNSGSPVFFYLGSDREPGSTTLGSPLVKLAGVMSGYFHEFVPLQIIKTANTPATRSSIGISAVTPAYLLHGLLFGDELKTVRGF